MAAQGGDPGSMGEELEKALGDLDFAELAKAWFAINENEIQAWANYSVEQTKTAGSYNAAVASHHRDIWTEIISYKLIWFNMIGIPEKTFLSILYDLGMTDKRGNAIEPRH